MSAGMSIESDKRGSFFNRTATRNFTGLSGISMESEAPARDGGSNRSGGGSNVNDGATPGMNRSKFFLRHQNSIDFVPVMGLGSGIFPMMASSYNKVYARGDSLMNINSSNLPVGFLRRSNNLRRLSYMDMSIEQNMQSSSPA